MAEITNNVANRFTLVSSEQDELHVFRVPAGTVIHITSSLPEDGANAEDHPTLGILVDDEAAPALIEALQRMSKAQVSA